jgi:predicted ribosomally synthesized peptide with SipW-like signal peptide
MEKTTMAKTFKTKLVLGILAATLTLALAIGGTLMLFTASTEAATNVVTLGNLNDNNIKLQEYVDEDGSEANPRAPGYANVGEDYNGTNEQATTIPGTGEQEDQNLFTGLDFGDTVVPNTTLEKRPRVYNDSNIPVYVMVTGELIVQNAAGDVVEWDDLTVAEKTELQLILKSVGSGDLGANWRGTATASNTDGNLEGIYYLANANGILVALAAKTATEDIFQTVKIPEEVTSLISGYKISLKLTAYAVQSDNFDNQVGEDPNVIDIDDLKAIFSMA